MTCDPIPLRTQQFQQFCCKEPLRLFLLIPQSSAAFLETVIVTEASIGPSYWRVCVVVGSISLCRDRVLKVRNFTAKLLIFVLKLIIHNRNIQEKETFRRMVSVSYCL
jgi:hypothetical protein